MGHITHLNTVRGLASTVSNQDGFFDEIRGCRILLAVSGPGNRSLLRDQLCDDFELVEPQGSADQLAFDLAIVDTENYRQWREILLDEKLRSEPTFLPVILILSRDELKNRLRSFAELVDEFIITPVDRLEFSERVAMLLRARHLAKSQRDQLAYLATHDRVTGLPNQQRFIERLSENILDASVLDQTVHVIVIKLNVNRIMNSLGHKGLDTAASICTTRLASIVGRGVDVARLTTETWGIVCPPGEPPDKVFALCQKLHKIVEQPLNIDGELIHIDIAVGVGLYPDDAQDAMRVLDAAINAVGTASKNRPQFYSKAVQHEALRFIRTETRLRQALIEDQFELWYQPQINLSTHTVTGVEALIRWRLPNGRLAPPADFLNVAESTGLLVSMDRWVLQQACKDMASWRKQWLGIERVAVNVTSYDVQEPDFVEFVRRQLEQFELPPPTLELELTESALFRADTKNLEKLNDLRSFGLDIAIDDFGTGYSSLGYLHTLPITILKIDQSFVRDILAVETDAAITKTIIWLAKNFGLRTIAEGVETPEQAEYLQSIGADTVQGFHYAKPMPEHELKPWLERWHEATRSRVTGSGSVSDG